MLGSRPRHSHLAPSYQRLQGDDGSAEARAASQSLGAERLEVEECRGVLRARSVPCPKGLPRRMSGHSQLALHTRLLDRGQTVS